MKRIGRAFVVAADMCQPILHTYLVNHLSRMANPPIRLRCFPAPDPAAAAAAPAPAAPVERVTQAVAERVSRPQRRLNNLT